MCKQCETKPVYEFTNKRKVCKSCFIIYFQKKVLYTIRKFNMVEKGDVVGYTNSKTLLDVVLRDVLKMYACKGHVELVKMPSKKKVSKIAVSENIDFNTKGIIESVVKGNLSKMRLNPVNKKVIKPLYLFTDAEIKLYAKINNLNFKVVKVNKDKLGKFIDDLEEKHPEVKRAIVNGYLALED